MEFFGLTAPTNIMNPEVIISEDQPEFSKSHDETPSDYLDHFYSSETVNPEMIIIEDQPQLFYDIDISTAFQDQMHPSVNPEIIIIEDHPEFFCVTEPSSDLQGQMQPLVIIIEDHPEFFCVTEPSSDLQGQMQSLGEKPFLILHEDNVLIPPADHSRHLPARTCTDHVPMRQASQNNELDSSQKVFWNLNQRFASLIQRRRRRFNKLPCKARRRLLFNS